MQPALRHHLSVSPRECSRARCRSGVAFATTTSQHAATKPGSAQKPSTTMSAQVELQAITVFCGASTGKDAEYMAAAKRMGEVMVQQRLKLVYGGAPQVA